MASLQRIELKLDSRPTETQVNEKLAASAREQALKDQLQDNALKDLQEEVSRVSSWFTWAGRLVGGALGLAVLGLVVVKPL